MSLENKYLDEFICYAKKQGVFEEFTDLFRDLNSPQNIQAFKEEGEELGYNPSEYIESIIESLFGTSFEIPLQFKYISKAILSGKLKKYI